MKNRTLTIIVASTLFLATTNGALAASNQDYMEKCKAAINTDPLADAEQLQFRFKSVRGGSIKTLKFDAIGNETKELVICKVKRGEVTDITWPDKKAS